MPMLSSSPKRLSPRSDDDLELVDERWYEKKRASDAKIGFKDGRVFGDKGGISYQSSREELERLMKFYKAI